MINKAYKPYVLCYYMYIYKMSSCNAHSACKNGCQSRTTPISDMILKYAWLYTTSKIAMKRSDITTIEMQGKAHAHCLQVLFIFVKCFLSYLRKPHSEKSICYCTDSSSIYHGTLWMQNWFQFLVKLPEVENELMRPYYQPFFVCIGFLTEKILQLKEKRHCQSKARLYNYHYQCNCICLTGSTFPDWLWFNINYKFSVLSNSIMISTLFEKHLQWNGWKNLFSSFVFTAALIFICYLQSVLSPLSLHNLRGYIASHSMLIFKALFVIAFELQTRTRILSSWTLVNNYRTTVHFSN